MGAFILYNLGLLHIPVAFVLTFVPLAFLQAWYTGQPWQAGGPVTNPMFQLFIFFMITDPKDNHQAAARSQGAGGCAGGRRETFLPAPSTLDIRCITPCSRWSRSATWSRSPGTTLGVSRSKLSPASRQAFPPSTQPR